MLCAFKKPASFKVSNWSSMAFWSKSKAFYAPVCIRERKMRQIVRILQQKSPMNGPWMGLVYSFYTAYRSVIISAPLTWSVTMDDGSNPAMDSYDNDRIVDDGRNDSARLSIGSMIAMVATRNKNDFWNMVGSFVDLLCINRYSIGIKFRGKLWRNPLDGWCCYLICRKRHAPTRSHSPSLTYLQSIYRFDWLYFRARDGGARADVRRTAWRPGRGYSTKSVFTFFT